MLTDHLGLWPALRPQGVRVAVTDANGTLTNQQRYLPFGQTRTDLNGPRITNTDFGYTGQRNNSYIKLDDYKSRWYSDQLGRFISPDSIVPNVYNPQSLNRYAYVNNRPINLNDPTGHRNCEEDGYNCPGDHPATPVIPPSHGNGSGSNSGGNGGGNPQDYQYHLHSDVNLYELGWQNFGTAWSIGTNPNSSLLAKLIAAEYMGAWGGAHVVLGIGLTGLACAAFVSCLTAVECALGIGASDYGNLSQAADYGIQPYNQLAQTLRQSGLETHHLIEQRLAPALGQTYARAQQWVSVAVTGEEHQDFTNAWRQAIGYINSNNAMRTDTATPGQIWSAAQNIYADYPALLDGARRIIFGP